MPFELVRRKHLEDDLAKIARRELRNTVRSLTRPEIKFGDVIHESRKSVKKVRAIAASLQEAGTEIPGTDLERLKSAAKALGGLRDSAAIVETLELVHRRYPRQFAERTFRAVRRFLIGVRNQEEARAKRDGVVAKASQRLVKARRSAKDWRSPTIEVSKLVEVITTSYRRSQKAMERSRTTGQSATLHRWRKELKTLWYQLRLLKPLTVGVAPAIADMKRLETALGDDHNLVVMVATLRRCRELRSMTEGIRRIEHLATRMRRPIRRRAFTLGRRVHSREPEAFARWIHSASTKR
jgi:CHAD domain-containing protein